MQCLSTIGVKNYRLCLGGTADNLFMQQSCTIRTLGEPAILRNGS